MHESIQAHFSELEEALKVTNLPADRKKTIAGFIKQLPPLYTQYRLTNESRYGDQITRLVQEVMRALEGCPEAQELDAAFRQKLKLLHQGLGVPQLSLKPAKPPPVAKKTRKKK
jgi:hypothetical protein